MTARYPVFIVGSPRSGTSVLVNALFAAGYHGFREGNFLSLISGIDSLVERQFKWFANGNPNVLVNAVEKDRLKRELFQVIRRLVEERNREAPWLDKTGNPAMIEAIPVLRTLWPDGVFIFAKRRGIENVVSRMIKFPSHNFEQHCADWARNMNTWRAVRSELPPRTFVEIDQQDMIRAPEDTANVLSGFLRLNSRDCAELVRVFQSQRPQETDIGSAGRLTSFESVSWNDSQRATFMRCCKAEMDAFGYSLGPDYLASAG